MAVLYDVHCAWGQDRASTLRPLFRTVCSHTGALAVPVSIRVTLRLFLAGLSTAHLRADWREGAVSEFRHTTLSRSASVSVLHINGPTGSHTHK